MASAVRFTKDERFFILRAIIVTHNQKEERLRESIVTKLERSELVKKRAPDPGIGWGRALSVMKEVLGPRLVIPPHPTGEWMGRIANRIRVLGLTEEDCRTLARNVSSWRGTISFERLIQGADRYLAGPVDASTGTKAGPLAMEEL